MRLATGAEDHEFVGSHELLSELGYGTSLAMW